MPAHGFWYLHQHPMSTLDFGLYYLFQPHEHIAGFWYIYVRAHERTIGSVHFLRVFQWWGKTAKGPFSLSSPQIVCDRRSCEPSTAGTSYCS
jgi:hypothetical protein